MGFMGMDRVVDSDNAADLSFNVAIAVAAVLKKGLKLQDNCWNTSGAVNVALVFEELIIPATTSAYLLDDELVKLAAKCVQMLAKENKVATHEFGNDYSRMINSLNKFIKDANRY